MVMFAFALLAPSYASVEAMKNTQEPEAGRPVEFSFGGKDGREFLLNGKPFQIRSGEMHPQRIPRQHWRHRIRAAKAMGLNTIAFYTFWNDLERPDGRYDFSGMRDIGAFLDMCQEEGMWVLFRPGPYVCGEWDLGGLPARLLKDKAPLRTMKNSFFMREQARYLEEMARIAIPRLCQKGGPILMIQLENEYGSYHTPHVGREYLCWLRDFWTEKGASTFYLSEGVTQQHLRHVIPDVAIGLDPAESERDFVVACRVSPNVPVFSSETYPGWLRHWGEGNWAPSRSTLQSVRWYMEHGVSFNLFVLHGGTSFGLSAGANSTNEMSDDVIQPDVTSYDYGSPIGENGNLTKEYFEYRDIIGRALSGVGKPSLPEPPQTPESMEIPAFEPSFICRAGELLSESPVKYVSQPLTLEELGQNQGLAVYSVRVPAGSEAFLRCSVHDRAQVFLDGKYLGDISRMRRDGGIQLPSRDREMQLTLLVDTFGHINFSAKMEQDNKGLVGKVTLEGQELKGWQIRLLPLQEEPLAPLGEEKSLTEKSRSSDEKGEIPSVGGLFQAEVSLEKVADTFFDMAGWRKGYMWVNGHLLGRYWSIGPQQRLYCPAEWLKQGNNCITILDTDTLTPAPVKGCTGRNMEILQETQNANNVW